MTDTETGRPLEARVEELWKLLESIQPDQIEQFFADFVHGWTGLTHAERERRNECWTRLFWIRVWRDNIASGLTPDSYQREIDALRLRNRRLQLLARNVTFQLDNQRGLVDEVDEYTYWRTSKWITGAEILELRDYVTRLIGLRNRLSKERGWPVYVPSRDPFTMTVKDRRLLQSWARTQMDIVEKLLLSDAYPEKRRELDLLMTRDAET